MENVMFSTIIIILISPILLAIAVGVKRVITWSMYYLNKNVMA